MTTTMCDAGARPDPGAREQQAGPLRRLLPDEQDVLFRAAVGLTKRQDEAADLVQETYLRALRAEPSLDLRPFGVRPWLLTILRNVFLNQRSRARRGRVIPLNELDEAPVAPASSQSSRLPHAECFDWEQVDERLKGAVEALPIMHRDVLLLWAVEGRPYAGIAAELGIPVGTVMSRLHRARRLVAESLRSSGRVGGRRRGEPEFSFPGE